MISQMFPKGLEKNLKFENNCNGFQDNKGSECLNCSHADGDLSLANNAEVKGKAQKQTISRCDSNIDDETEEDKKVKKKKSGILTKPDKVDIVCTV